MARVTVEDCLENVENRFKLVLLASKRARQLALGAEPLVEWENDKPTVVALREIAKDLVNEEMMQASLAVPAEEELEFDEDDLAAALHAEISRELSQATAETPATKPEPKIASQPPAPLPISPIFGGGLGAITSDPSPAEETPSILPVDDSTAEGTPEETPSTLFANDSTAEGTPEETPSILPVNDSTAEGTPEENSTSDLPASDSSSEGEQGS